MSEKLQTHITNPKTGRLVKIGGPTHKKLLKQKLIEENLSFKNLSLDDTLEEKPAKPIYENDDEENIDLESVTSDETESEPTEEEIKEYTDKRVTALCEKYKDEFTYAYNDKHINFEEFVKNLLEKEEENL